MSFALGRHPLDQTPSAAVFRVPGSSRAGKNGPGTQLTAAEAKLAKASAASKALAPPNLFRVLKPRPSTPRQAPRTLRSPGGGEKKKNCPRLLVAESPTNSCHVPELQAPCKLPPSPYSKSSGLSPNALSSEPSQSSDFSRPEVLFATRSRAVQLIGRMEASEPEASEASEASEGVERRASLGSVFFFFPFFGSILFFF